MIDFFFLIPIAIGLGLIGLASFMWTLKNGQYDDLEGAAARILFEVEAGPLPENGIRDRLRPKQKAIQRPADPANYKAGQF
ncbi:MAG: cbb3-type cytochrome oxidase assembly protein CcoS [Bradyrhizobium sp.]|nr:cbb3-type cytochrome oxidase assembly protein CcoS [Bradyrhizobium sp.]